MRCPECLRLIYLLVVLGFSLAVFTPLYLYSAGVVVYEYSYATVSYRPPSPFTPGLRIVLHGLPDGAGAVSASLYLWAPNGSLVPLGSVAASGRVVDVLGEVYAGLVEGYSVWARRLQSVWPSPSVVDVGLLVLVSTRADGLYGGVVLVPLKPWLIARGYHVLAVVDVVLEPLGGGGPRDGMVWVLERVEYVGSSCAPLTMVLARDSGSVDAVELTSTIIVSSGDHGVRLAFASLASLADGTGGVIVAGYSWAAGAAWLNVHRGFWGDQLKGAVTAYAGVLVDAVWARFRLVGHGGCGGCREAPSVSILLVRPAGGKPVSNALYCSGVGGFLELYEFFEEKGWVGEWRVSLHGIWFSLHYANDTIAGMVIPGLVERLKGTDAVPLAGLCIDYGRGCGPPQLLLVDVNGYSGSLVWAPVEALPVRAVWGGWMGVSPVYALVGERGAD